ncbi:MAG: hypothetical protein RIB43_14720 [Rhodospirillaceae bacterium]
MPVDISGYSKQPHLRASHLVGVLATMLAFLTAPAQAQQTTTGVAFGSDFWTGSMNPELFQLHNNGGEKACDLTEKFVTVRGSLGFCIDADEHSAGALEWEDARETCAAEGKRLPEVSEFKFACQAGISGLNNMTGNREWLSNFATFTNKDPQNFQFTTIAPQSGADGCADQNFGWVTRSDLTTSASATTFRCVR